MFPIVITFLYHHIIYMYDFFVDLDDFFAVVCTNFHENCDFHWICSHNYYGCSKCKRPQNKLKGSWHSCRLPPAWRPVSTADCHAELPIRFPIFKRDEDSSRGAAAGGSRRGRQTFDARAADRGASPLTGDGPGGGKIIGSGDQQREVFNSSSNG